MNNPQQPGKYDAVLGANSPSLEGAAVLGGIEGVKLRLKNPDSKVRIAALEQALMNYGEQGFNLVIEALKDESVEIQDAAYLLLNTLLYMYNWHLPLRVRREDRESIDHKIKIHKARLEQVLRQSQYWNRQSEIYKRCYSNNDCNINQDFLNKIEQKRKQEGKANKTTWEEEEKIWREHEELNIAVEKEWDELQKEEDELEKKWNEIGNTSWDELELKEWAELKRKWDKLYEKKAEKEKKWDELEEYWSKIYTITDENFDIYKL